MKKLFFTFSCLIFLSTLRAQTLYGTTAIGGKGGGTISRLVPGNSTLTADFTFDTQDGENAWYAKLLQATDGKLYGMTYVGGSAGYGTIFSYNPATATYTKLINFDGNNGKAPYSSLMQAADSKLYGMTYSGGNSNKGVIFSYNPASAVYAKLVDFDGFNGAYPFGSLVQASDGKLYGMTQSGGIYDKGVIFSISTATGVYAKLKDFDGTNGSSPFGSFLQASDGKLYATTFNGGSNSYGTIFSYTPSNGAFNKLKDLDFANGCNPYGSFVQATDGKLYSTAWNGGNNSVGVIFSYNINTTAYAKLKDFDFANGFHPHGDLTQMPDGKLYGMTTEGGSYSSGVLFSYNLTTVAYTKVKDLNSTIGSYPYGSLTRASDGKLYGMTYAGGNGNDGVIFSYNITNAVYTNLRDFGVNSTGSLVYGGVVNDTSGKLYGMTSSGGSYAQGVLFSFDPATAIYTKHFDFNGLDGASPFGSLMLASDNKLYGMTLAGGSYSAGVIFSYNPATSNYVELKDFDYDNGGFPYGNLVQASNGKLYGMTNGGGINGSGVIFSYDPVTFVYIKLVDFTGANGAYPQGSLMQAKDEKLYGVSYNGGNNDWGVLFSYNISTGVYKKIRDFDVAGGFNPNGTLVQAPDGKLYGMTTNGGGNYFGTIFSYSPSTGIYTKVKDFDYTNGANPSGSLMTASDGKLYGMTTEGGAYKNGVAFSFDPVSAAYTKIQDFNDTNGKRPIYSFFTEVSSAATIKINNTSIQEGNNGSKTMTFTVTLSKASSQTVIIDYKTKDATAIAPGDYTAKRGRLSFAPGIKKQTVTIAINGDTQAESDEKLKVLLGNAVNTILADSVGVGTILNDDAGFIANKSGENYTNNAPVMSISPNPATNIIHLELKGFAGNLTLQLLDMQGKLLKENKIEADNVKYTQQQFNVSDVAGGTYFIIVLDDKGKKQAKKITVMH